MEKNLIRKYRIHIAHVAVSHGWQWNRQSDLDLYTRGEMSVEARWAGRSVHTIILLCDGEEIERLVYGDEYKLQRLSGWLGEPMGMGSTWDFKPDVLAYLDWRADVALLPMET